MFKDFGKRLQRDVKALVDGRIAGSEARSGSLMKVSSHYHRVIEAGLTLKVERCRGQCHFTQTTTICSLVRRIPDGVYRKLCDPSFC
jgi:hypothetical protein